MNAFSKKLPLDTVSLPYKGYDKWSPDIVLKRELVSLILPIHCPFFIGACNVWVSLINLFLKFREDF